jgi:Rps23 Pro-64 3,4-dihydroxylase Tpa1-like proline 4-hydroxylase
MWVYNEFKVKTRKGNLPVRKMVMKKRTLAPGIVIYSDVIDDHESLIDEIEKGVSKNFDAWYPATAIINGQDVPEKTIRDTDSLYIEYQDHIVNNTMHEYYEFKAKLSNTFLLGFKDLELDYKKEYNIGTEWHDSYGILKYGPGQKVVNHIDDNHKYHRRISTVYYLNDNYSGGEITFPRFDITYKPVANEFLIFPSNYVYNHSVIPVTEGIRYSVVSWLR